MKIEKTNRLETFLKIGGFVIAAVGCLLAVLQFTKSCGKTDPLAEERKQIYIEVSQLVGKILATENRDTLNKLSDEFNVLYNGRMNMVEGQSAVSLSMRRFRYELDDKLNGVKNVLNQFKFKTEGLKLIRECQKQLNN